MSAKFQQQQASKSNAVGKAKCKHCGLDILRDIRSMEDHERSCPVTLLSKSNPSSAAISASAKAMRPGSGRISPIKGGRGTLGQLQQQPSYLSSAAEKVRVVRILEVRIDSHELLDNITMFNVTVGAIGVAPTAAAAQHILPWVVKKTFSELLHFKRSLPPSIALSMSAIFPSPELLSRGSFLLREFQDKRTRGMDAWFVELCGSKENMTNSAVVKCLSELCEVEYYCSDKQIEERTKHGIGIDNNNYSNGDFSRMRESSTASSRSSQDLNPFAVAEVPDNPIYDEFDTQHNFMKISVSKLLYYLERQFLFKCYSSNDTSSLVDSHVQVQYVLECESSDGTKSEFGSNHSPPSFSIVSKSCYINPQSSSIFSINELIPVTSSRLIVPKTHCYAHNFLVSMDATTNGEGWQFRSAWNGSSREESQREPWVSDPALVYKSPVTATSSTRSTPDKDKEGLKSTALDNRNRSETFGDESPPAWSGSRGRSRTTSSAENVLPNGAAACKYMKRRLWYRLVIPTLLRPKIVPLIAAFNKAQALIERPIHIGYDARSMSSIEEVNSDDEEGQEGNDACSSNHNNNNNVQTVFFTAASTPPSSDESEEVTSFDISNRGELFLFGNTICSAVRAVDCGGGGSSSRNHVGTIDLYVFGDTSVAEIENLEVKNKSGVYNRSGNGSGAVGKANERDDKANKYSIGSAGGDGFRSIRLYHRSPDDSTEARDEEDSCSDSRSLILKVPHQSFDATVFKILYMLALMSPDASFSRFPLGPDSHIRPVVGEEVLASGSLYKLSVNQLEWKQRYFELSCYHIRYFRGCELRGFIDIPASKLFIQHTDENIIANGKSKQQPAMNRKNKIKESDNRDFQFTVRTYLGFDFTMKAKSLDEQSKWIKCISEQINGWPAELDVSSQGDFMPVFSLSETFDTTSYVDDTTQVNDASVRKQLSEEQVRFDFDPTTASHNLSLQQTILSSETLSSLSGYLFYALAPTFSSGSKQQQLEQQKSSSIAAVNDVKSAFGRGEGASEYELEVNRDSSCNDNSNNSNNSSGGVGGSSNHKCSSLISGTANIHEAKNNTHSSNSYSDSNVSSSRSNSNRIDTLSLPLIVPNNTPNSNLNNSLFVTATKSGRRGAYETAELVITCVFLSIFLYCGIKLVVNK